MRYRVDELAARCGVSVDTVRYYQAKGLLPRPEREGRIAWYSDEHLERLGRIRDLKAKGLTLEVIARVLSGELDASGEALAVALSGPLPGDAGDATGDAREELLDLEELSRRTGVSLALLAAIEREGLLVPRTTEDDLRYTAADADAVRAGLALLEAGVPLSELLALAREHDRAMRAVADRAVDLFARYVRDPIRGSASSELEAAEQTVRALQAMLPAVGAVVAHHFRRRLLAAASDRLGDDAGALAPGRAEAETEPSHPEPSETEPSEPSQPSGTEPSATEPSATEPSATEPSGTEPSATGPSGTEPSETEPSEPSQPFESPHAEPAHVEAQPSAPPHAEPSRRGPQRKVDPAREAG